MIGSACVESPPSVAVNKKTEIRDELRVISSKLKWKNTAWIKYDRLAGCQPSKAAAKNCIKTITRSRITPGGSQTSRTGVTGASILAKINHQRPVSCCSKVKGQRCLSTVWLVTSEPAGI